MKKENRMVSEKIFVLADHSLQKAASILRESGRKSIPVIDKEQNIMGVLTTQQILSAIAEGKNILAPVKDILASSIYTGFSNNDFEHALVSYANRFTIFNEGESDRAQAESLETILNLHRNLLLEIEAIINSTHNIIVSIDRQGKIKVFNRSAEKALSMKAEDVIGKSITEIFPTSSLLEVAQSGVPNISQKFELKGKLFITNRTPIIQDDKETIGAVAVLQDISEIEEISKELQFLKSLHKELDAIFESSFDGIWVADGTGKTLKVNKASEEIFGVPRNHLLGKHPSELVAQGIYSRSVIMRAIERRETVTAKARTKTGKTILATSTPVLDENDKISLVVTNIRDMTQLFELKSELEHMKGLTQLYQQRLQKVELQKSFIYQSTKMSEVVSLTLRLAEVDCSVLITGASGVGKEMIADIIHKNSKRREGPFIKVNCGAIPENLLEAELFGYEPGAFTGSNRSGKLGLFALANRGILLLDEIGELPLNLQVKLLRVVQDKKITRLGGSKVHSVDVRILAATNRNLEKMIANKEFRADLYFRLNVASIRIPSINERREDILPLINHFLDKFNLKYKMNKRITSDLIDNLVQHDWSGNVRELENVIERLVVTVPDAVITTHDLPRSMHAYKNEEKIKELIPLKLAVENTERQLIGQVYKKFKSTREMAKVLNVHQSTLIRKAAKYGISKKSSSV